MFEKDLPGKNTAGFNEQSVIGDLPLETCETINGAWGYNAGDKRFKSTRDLIHYLVRAAGYNANFLLNVGPMPTGKIQPEFVSRLQETGAWLKQYGDSVYGTRGGPVSPRPWGVTTRRGNRIYLHILDWPDPVLAMPSLGGRVKSATAMKNGARVEIVENESGLLVRIPRDAVDQYDTVISVEIEP
jgi:alpha-L-fucosidase